MKRAIFCLLAMIFSGGTVAQIPVELFGGNEKASFDLMFFKFFKNEEGQNSRLLFFSRERAVVDYQQTSDSRLPQFGFTEALSYNHPALKGFAPVVVGQILNAGAFAKTGVQYARVSHTLTAFGWSVVEIKKRPFVDVFLLLRFTPALNAQWHFFSQLELINNLPTDEAALYVFTQRLRVGLKRGEWQFGVGGDFSAVGRGDFSRSQNMGGFLRHEF
ncbi:MAG: hypothetical protein SFV52_07035 [Saprospiraceae bacterium]|nr:hypothetical protein [Saprospiraceae bacterium]